MLSPIAAIAGQSTWGADRGCTADKDQADDLLRRVIVAVALNARCRRSGRGNRSGSLSLLFVNYAP